MYCEFIRQVIHITQYEDFQDIQIVVLPSLRFVLGGNLATTNGALKLAELST